MRNRPSSAPRKVLVAEFNEITWRVLGPLIAAGKLPEFSAFVRDGASGTSLATELPPHLDPWVCWTTLYTGRRQESHGVRFLEQPPETVTAPRVWELAADAGRKVGVFGSIMSWPPRKEAAGFWVPSAFSPDTSTHPEELRPIQELNVNATRGHSPLAKKGRGRMALRLAARLFRLGLRPSTAARAAACLVQCRVRPEKAWKQVSLQPLVNIDFFERLYRRHRPDLATFHTNHVAHYQHRYWRSWAPEPFLTPPPEDEVRRFRPAIEHGYLVADAVLGRLWRLADRNTVVIVASGLGQQPHVVERFAGGRPIVRLRDIRRLVQLCGAAGQCQAVAVMAPQWNLKLPDPLARARAERVLGSAWVGDPGVRLFSFQTVGDTINLNVSQNATGNLDMSACCTFPDAGGQQIPLGDLCATEDPTPKQGCHHPAGVALLRGAGVRRGVPLAPCTNLDFAPTILHLLGLPVLASMNGRILHEALETGNPRAISSAAARTVAA
jgi:hypothetical protein